MRKQIVALGSLCLTSAGALFAGCSNSSPREAFRARPEPPLIEFLGTWGTKGQGPGLLANPRSIATDAFSKAYISDAGSPTRYIHKFSRDGHPLFSFEPLAPLREPCAMAVDRGGAIYVLECSAGVLYLFLPDGTLLHGIRGGMGASAKPSSVAVDDNGRIYVAESHARRVVSFTSQGRFLGALQEKNSKPITPLSADQVAAGPNGSIYVADSARQWIARVSNDGTVENSWQVTPFAPSARTATAGAGDEYADTLNSLAVSQKYVVVLTGPAKTPVLHVFTLDGQEKMAKPLQDLDPSIGDVTIVGIAAASDGELFILDFAAPRVLRFRLN